MQALIFKTAQGEYDAYEEELLGAYLTQDDAVLASDITLKWYEYLEQQKKIMRVNFREVNNRSPKSYEVELYIAENFDFKIWLAEAYPELKEINCSEGYIR